MPTRFYCPHCITPCLVADQHVGRPVRCYRCGKAFTAQPTGIGDAALPKSTPADEPHRGPPRLEIGSATSPGRQRPRNEDSFLVSHQAWYANEQRHEIALVLVIDGMGGHEAGDQASAMAVRTIGSTLAPLLTGALTGQFKDLGAPALGESLTFAIQEASHAIYRKAHADRACKGMGATAAVALLWDSDALIAHVGDCRVYRQHAGRLTQVTKDQTVVARMVELGKLTPEEAADHPARNEVSQALGTSFDVKLAPIRLRLEYGDWLVMACDGLHTHVDDPTLQQEITRSAQSAAHLSRQLVELADQRGGSDNCSVVAVRCT
jgi:protein phosphatase